MIVYSDVVTRPSTDVLWNKCLSSEILTYLETTYFMSKILSFYGTFTDLEQRTIIIFDSMSSYDEYFNDPQLSDWRACKDNHNNSNGIIRSNVQLRDMLDIEETQREQILSLVGTFGLYKDTGDLINSSEFIK